DVRSNLVPRARGQDGERDAPGVEVDGVLHVPDRGSAALALPLVRRAVVPHVLVDHELVATLEQVDERDRPVNAGDLDRAVELDHRQPPPGRGDRVALTGVRLLADQQLLARRLPGGQVDDWRLAGEVAARVAGRGRQGCPPLSRLVRSLAPWGSLSVQTTHDAETHRSASGSRNPSHGSRLSPADDNSATEAENATEPGSRSPPPSTTSSASPP